MRFALFFLLRVYTILSLHMVNRRIWDHDLLSMRMAYWIIDNRGEMEKMVLNFRRASLLTLFGIMGGCLVNQYFFILVIQVTEITTNA
jgi:hypothetical protein